MNGNRMLLTQSDEAIKAAVEEFELQVTFLVRLQLAVQGVLQNL
jgi:hypothetical protein